MPLRVITTADYIAINSHMAVAEISPIEGNQWWFNRLFVNPSFRNRGIATSLMAELCEILDEKQITLLCAPNPYGDLDLKQLTKFYKNFGFKKRNKILTRYPLKSTLPVSADER